MGSSAYLDALRDVLGGVVEPFVPTVNMTVYYGTSRLVNGSQLQASMVKATPRVLIGGEPDELFTMVMIDPDAPNPNDPKLKELVSWIVTNIPGGKSCAEGMELVSYEGPNPPIGIHRYMLILYKQRASLNDIEALESRVHFRVRAFAREHNLGKPVGVAYYNVRRANKRKTKA